MSIELHQGDCLEVMKNLPDKSVDCFICDLPYGQLSAGYDRPNHNDDIKKKLTKQTEAHCAWDVKIDLKEFWKQVERLAKNDNTPIIHFCNTKFGIDLINSKPDWFRYDLVWDKQRGVSFLLANKMPMKSHEMIYVFSKKGAYYNRVDIDEPGKLQYKESTTKSNHNVYSSDKLIRSQGAPDNKRCVNSVIVMKKVGTFKQAHPTEKPLELYKWLIERYCPENGTLLDPTAGSFNSCFAGYELDRNCIGIEMDDKFYKKACERADKL